jgi:hypothetical protein
MEVYFLCVVLGFPLAILIVAIIGGYLHREDDAEMLGWPRPGTAPGAARAEAKREILEINQMLAAQNELRRRRGVPERSLDEVTEDLGDAYR